MHYYYYQIFYLAGYCDYGILSSEFIYSPFSGHKPLKTAIANNLVIVSPEIFTLTDYCLLYSEASQLSEKEKDGNPAKNPIDLDLKECPKDKLISVYFYSIYVENTYVLTGTSFLDYKLYTTKILKTFIERVIKKNELSVVNYRLLNFRLLYTGSVEDLLMMEQKQEQISLLEN